MAVPLSIGLYQRTSQVSCTHTKELGRKVTDLVLLSSIVLFAQFAYGTIDRGNVVAMVRK